MKYIFLCLLCLTTISVNMKNQINVTTVQYKDANWQGKLNKITHIRLHIQTATKICEPFPPVIWVSQTFDNNINNSSHSMPDVQK